MKHALSFKTQIALKGDESNDNNEINWSARCNVVRLSGGTNHHPPLRMLRATWVSLMTAVESGHGIRIFLRDLKNGSQTLRAFTEDLSDVGVSCCHTSMFTALVFVLFHLLRNNHLRRKTTIRDIFYQDVSLFRGKQAITTNALQLITNALKISSSAIGVRPSPKGLIWASQPVQINTRPGCCIIISGDPALIPYELAADTLTFSKEPRILLVLEKEATFFALCDYASRKSFDGPLLIVCGRGFPDRLTANFVESVRCSCPSTKIEVFVDSDVYGLRIFWAYANAMLVPSSISLRGVFLLEPKTMWLTMSRREHRRNQTFLKQLHDNGFHEHGKTIGLIKRELKRALMLQKRAEMNSSTTGVSGFIDSFILHKWLSS